MSLDPGQPDDDDDDGDLPTADPATPAAPGYALFDLDHTLLPFDTQALFANFVIRREPWRVIYLIWFLPCVPLAALRIVSLRWLKRLFCSYLWKMPKDRLAAHARDFAQTVLPRVVYPEVLVELRRHQKAGRLTVLNSASPGIYVAEIARVLGFDHWVATRLVWYEVMPFLPEIDGPNNKHEAKIEAMRHLLPSGFDPARGDRLPDSWGYSDSAADVPLLSICEHAMMIHPSSRFAALGTERRWWTLLPPRPYRGRWGGRLASLLQACGLYRVRGDRTLDDLSAD